MPEFKDKVSHHIELFSSRAIERLGEAQFVIDRKKDDKLFRRWIKACVRISSIGLDVSPMQIEQIILFQRFKKSGKKNFKKWLSKELSMLEKMLIEKNEKYGNSALEPLRIFSSSDSVEQINVRMDDKLSRIYNQKDDDEDAELDFLGYYILREIALTYPSSLFYR